MVAGTGRVLRVNPLFGLWRGEIHRRRPALSRDAALDRLVRAVRDGASGVGRLHLAVMVPPGERDLARELLDRVGGSLDASATVAEAFVSEPGSVILHHAGPTITGLAWWWAQDGPDVTHRADFDHGA